MSLIILTGQVEKFNLDYYEANEKFKLISPQYENINKINNVFLNCYFDTKTWKKNFKT